MHENNLAALLKGKTLVEQAVWYRIFALYNIRRGEWARNYQNKFDEYLLTMDKSIVQYPQKVTRDNEWKRELDALKNTIIQDSIISKLHQFDDLSMIPAGMLVAWAQCLGAILATSLKTNQIRRFLGAILEAEVEVKKEKPENFSKQQAEYLKVYLAYAAGRNRAVLPLLAVLDPMINLVRPEGRDGWEDFNKLVRFVRAVVAYHKFYGGDD